MGCDAYRLRHKPKQQPGQPPTVPVAYIQIPQECGAKELFGVILEHLKYQVVKGTIAEIRDRTMRVLKGCCVEMLIIDEAIGLNLRRLLRCGIFLISWKFR
jgi:DNA transposition AAA+ family ATPase